MDQKGFTLIELIVTIGLMTLMGVLIVSNLTSIFSREEEREFERYITTMEEAACSYIELSDPTIKAKKEVCKRDGCNILASSLILNGLIDENLVNPNTQKKITGSESILIRYESGEKICNYQAE